MILGAGFVRLVFALVSVLAIGCRKTQPQIDHLQLSHPQAQVEFARGLLLHYGFYADQALAAFEKAASIVPDDPLPRWAIALTLGPRTNDPDMATRMERAFTEAQAAMALSRNGDELTRGLAAAVAARYAQAATSDAKALNRAYAEAMAALAAKYPGNTDLATLYAEGLALASERPWWNAAGVSTADVSKGIAVLEPILAREPSHIGANHYYIHFIEGTPTPERALPHAQALEKNAPDVGHLLHMPSHIYMRTGAYHAAVAVNQKAVASDAARGDGHAHEGVEGMLVGHTREYLSAAAAMTGQSAVALEVDSSLFPLLRYQRWDDVNAYEKIEGSVGELEWLAAQAIALSGQRRSREARQQRQAFTAHARTLPAAATWWGDPIARFLPMAEAEMDARIAWAEGNRVASIEFWRQAVSAQDRLSRAEGLLSWFHPTRESLGAALHLVGNHGEAEQVFRDDLRANPNNPRSLFGLWQTLVAQQRGQEAADVKAQFDRAWRDADVLLTMESL